MGQRSYKAIFGDLAACAACTAVTLLWVTFAVRQVSDTARGVLILGAPLFPGLGAGVFFLGRALNALGRRFLRSLGWDQYLN